MEKMTTEKFVELVEGMTVLELSEAVKALEDKFGVSGAPMVAAAAVAGPAEAAKEEKSTFDVVLKEIGDEKIKVIKEVKAITGLSIKEAQGIVNGAPQKVKEGLAKEEAEEVKKKLEAAGAVVELA